MDATMIETLKDKLSSLEYRAPIRKGDKSTFNFVRDLIDRPLTVDEAYVYGLDILNRTRAFLFKMNLPLTVLKNDDGYFLAMRKIKGKA